MELMNAYRSLQLNPANVRQMTAFEALCWRLIRDRADGEWIKHVQSGNMPLAWIVGQTPGGRKLDARTAMNHTMHDETIEILTEEFVNTYGAHIWPWEWNKRAHLADTQDIEIKYAQAQYQARKDMIYRLEIARDVHRTDRMITVESKIGRLVREFLKKLLTSRLMPEQLDDSPEYLLSVILNRVPTQRWPCMQEGSRVDCSSSTTLAIHQDAHHRISGATTFQPVVVLDDEDEDEDEGENEDSQMTDPSGQADTQTATIVPTHAEITSERFLCSYPGCNQVYAWKEALFAHEAKAKHTVSEPAALIEPKAKRVKKSDQPPKSKSAESESHGRKAGVLGLGCTKPGCGRRFPYPNFPLFQAHEQQHERDSSAGGIDSTPEQNLTSGRDAHIDNNEGSNGEAQQESTGAQSEPDTNHLWGELFGEEN